MRLRPWREHARAKCDQRKSEGPDASFRKAGDGEAAPHEDDATSTGRPVTSGVASWLFKGNGYVEGLSGSSSSSTLASSARGSSIAGASSPCTLNSSFAVGPTVPGTPSRQRRSKWARRSRFEEQAFTRAVGQRAARLRKERGITQIEMAKRLGVSQPHVPLI